MSEIVLQGTNYRGDTYDEGKFYINDEPSITMRMGCYRRTHLGETMSPVVPVPTSNEVKPHESIAEQKFSLTLAHKTNAEIDLSDVIIDVEVNGTKELLRFVQKNEPPYSYSFAYEFVADLQCSDIVDGVLRIHLEPNKVREYGVQFEEGVSRDVSYHSGLTT